MKERASAIAKEAYVYGFPLVDSYRVHCAYFVDRNNPEFKAPWNQIRTIPRVFTPEDKAVQTRNSDTPCSFVGMDLNGACRPDGRRRGKDARRQHAAARDERGPRGRYGRRLG